MVRCRSRRFPVCWRRRWRGETFQRGWVVGTRLRLAVMILISGPGRCSPVTFRPPTSARFIVFSGWGVMIKRPSRGSVLTLTRRLRCEPTIERVTVIVFSLSFRLLRTSILTRIGVQRCRSSGRREWFRFR